MELDINGTNEPLLEDENGYDDINSLAILDGLRCVSYRETIVVPKLLRKNKTKVEERVKVIEDFDNNVPNKYVYQKENGKKYIYSDYMAILLLDSVKQLRSENNHLRDIISKMETRIYNLENK
tara:strand:+ start:122 stop:490 length:369 start_codon:yes stop_codon:yes gene_type:complete